MKIRTPKERRNERSRQGILRAALELIAVHGVANVSLREIARCSDYSPAALYEYFESKEAIIAAVAEQGFARLSSYLSAAQQESEPCQRLVEICQAYIRFARDYPAYFQLILTQLSSQRPSLATPVSGSSPYGILQQAVQDAIAAGCISIRENYGLEEIAYSLWALAHGMATLQATHLRDFAADFSATDRRALEIFVAAL